MLSLFTKRNDQSWLPGVINAHDNPRYYIHKPLGYSLFPKETSPVPKEWVEATGDLVWFRRHEKVIIFLSQCDLATDSDTVLQGGHFAALEEPEALLNDVEEFIKQVWEGALLE